MSCESPESEAIAITEEGIEEVVIVEEEVVEEVVVVVDPVVEPVAPPPEPIEPVIEPIIQGPILIATYDGLTLKGYDGIGWYDLLTGNVVNARNNFYASDQSGFPVLYELDSMGVIASEKNLAIMPDAILTSTAGLEYMCENIPPAEALSLGGQNKDYVQLWINGTTTGHWSTTQWKCADLIEVEVGSVFAIDSNGNRHGVNTPLVATFAVHGGLLRHTTNTSTRTGYFNGSYESWSTNYATSTMSNNWQLASGQWYSANGYIWDDVNKLQQQVNALDSFNFGPYPLGSESPVFHSVGVRVEVGEEVIYWLECNTGVLYRYVPSVDRIDTVDRLYIGDGSRLAGIAINKTINAFIVGDFVYFTDAGSLNRSELATSIHSVFVGAGLDSWGW